MTPQNNRDLPEVVAEILIEQHAMRQDIVGLRQEMKEVRQEIGGLRQEMHEQIGGLRQEMHEQIGGLRQEMKEEIGGLRQEMRESHTEMVGLFNNMTNAILDAMNRGTDRYEQTNVRVAKVETRVTRLENPDTNAA